MKLKTKYRILATLSLTALIIIILPLLIIGKYDFPTCDDFSYGTEVFQTYSQTHSILRAFVSSFDEVIRTWHGWQGTYSAVWLMSLQPSSWSVDAYRITPYIMIIPIVLSVFYCSKYVTYDIAKQPISVAIITSSIITGMIVLRVPFPVEGFFWFNGSIYYTFTFSIVLMYLVFLCKNLLFCNEKVKKMTVFTLLIFNIFIGGNNYPLGLLTLEITFLSLVYAIVKNSKNKLFLVLNWFTLLTAFLVNALAEGNKVRQANCIQSTVIQSILRSFKEAGCFIRYNCDLPILISVVILIPFIYLSVKRINVKFRLPVFFTLITFCLFSSLFTPTLYAQSLIGPKRLENVYFYMSYFLIVSNVFYWTGWVVKRGIKGLSQYIHWFREHFILCMGVMVSLLLISFLLFNDYKKLSTFSAYFSLRSGEAQQYYDENIARQEILNDSTLANVGLPEFTVKPYVLFFDDIETDSTNWKNYATAKYYGKESVWLIPNK